MTAKAVRLPTEVAENVAAAFGLGTARSTTLAARGWASLNLLWRVETSSGTWALKEVTREPPAWLEAAARIEHAAHAAGVAVAPVVRTTSGAVCAQVLGRVFRAHAWVEGVAPTQRRVPPPNGSHA